MFVFIYTANHSQPIALFDLKRKRFIDNRLHLGVRGALAADLAHHGCYGYKSSYASLGKLPRTSRGLIDPKAVPVRLSLEQLQVILPEALKVRPRLEAAPIEPPKALRGGLTADNRYQRPKVITDPMLVSATELRAEGHTWKIVAAALGVGTSAIKWSHQKMLSQGANGAAAV